MFFIIVFFFSVYYCYSWTTWPFLFIACDLIYILKVLQKTYSWLLMSFIFGHDICSCVLVSQRAVCLIILNEFQTMLTRTEFKACLQKLTTSVTDYCKLICNDSLLSFSFWLVLSSIHDNLAVIFLTRHTAPLICQKWWKYGNPTME